MMRRLLIIAIMLIALFPISGCGYTTIEHMTLTLLIGIDLDHDGNLVFAISSPVFSKEAKDKEEEFEVRATTLRHSREGFDKRALGLTMAGKTQIVIIGKKLAKQKDWSILLDPFYRDPKSTATARVVYYDGSIDEIMRYRPKDKPRLPLYLSNLVETGLFRNETTKTTIQEFHRQLKEDGITPSITALRKEEEELVLTGTALLDKASRVKMLIDSDEGKLIYILRKKTRGEFPFTLHLPNAPGQDIDKMDTKRISVNLHSIKTTTQARYERDRFIFDVNVHSTATISERLFPFNNIEPPKGLEKMIEEKLEQKFASLIRKLQKAKLDPAGFGMYARAYAYPHWKKVKENWLDNFQKSRVNIKVKVKIIGMGTVK
ncbi:germination protein [Brevibacillus halotolerans]|uniref:Ger(x)C family spore germination protein n=1 Tax=Brevibacillus halotolerans TaxID=1507437 RepID=UPI001B2F2FBC|nr:Ger(x)C family spore germination protein [Brevibacillus halotolerans]GIN99369.1 germination protein [Brevibacillus halotolerans]